MQSVGAACQGNLKAIVHDKKGSLCRTNLFQVPGDREKLPDAALFAPQLDNPCPTPDCLFRYLGMTPSLQPFRIDNDIESDQSSYFFLAEQPGQQVFLDGIKLESRFS